MPALSDFRDKIAVVTGASSGIGAELARQLARRGARVALVARRRERLEQLAKEIEAGGGRASLHVCDVASRAEVEAAAREVIAAHGGVDLLVNAAGYVSHVLFKDQDLDDIERMTRTNYLGSVYWIKAVLPSMRERRAGWIVNISSFAGLLPQPDEAAYSASKCAVTGLSEAIALEFAPLGIHVLAVHPALVRTEMFTPEVMARMPKGSEKRFIDADAFCAEVFRALERGETSLVVPRKYAFAPRLQALLPRRFTTAMAAQRLKVLPDLTD
jgi:short-subunit dehydrogenase